ncbi:MAG: tRNA (adenosine(37)-N6)-dimethylallyltransferase MiaA, partial [Methylophilaceae bacterium]|nr:tRNA (adenosine(37)-N6)-dimethylallyltransferase MiaA [Methylophilaceae bacterium]
LKQGFLEEVKILLKQYPALTPELPSMRCVGYRQALEHLAGEYDAAELRDRGIFATRQLAKRQLTWLRGMDDTFEVDCLNPNMYELVFNEINQFIKN